ncbi:MAG: 50S ribosomal protein L17 [Gaiellaceae bacterium]
MRHARTGKKLGRDSAHRKALYSNLAGALIEHGRIRTTVTKAKAVKPLAEQMITLGRRGDLHARRQATSFLRSRDVVHKLFAEVAPLFKDRPGGYTRIVKIGPRAGDSAEMAYLELVDEEYVAKEREARTPEPVATAVEEPDAEAEASDAGADEGADDGDDGAGDADEPEGLDEAGAEEAPADPSKGD